MTSPPAKASAGDESAGEPVEGVRGATQRALTPPPLPHASTQEASVPSPAAPAASGAAAADAPADVSSAPTIRPPPGLAPSSALALSAGGADGRGTGFTSVIRHLSLRGWLRWIHSNQCDATLRIRARDGGNGIIWCSAGTIVDAEWGAGSLGGASSGGAPSGGGLSGVAAPCAVFSSGPSPVVAERAVQEMLRLGSGSVSIDFDPVDRAPRVSRPTHELLHPLQAGAVLGDSRRATERHWSPGSMQEPAIRPALTLPADPAPAGPELASDAERTRARWRPRLRWRHLSRGSYLLGGMGFAALMLLAFIFGRSRGAQDSDLVVIGPPEQERAQQTRSGLRPPPAVASPPLTQAAASSAPRQQELPVIPFTEIEVEPAQSEIWLDQSLIGVGRIELAALRDGALHELRFVAPGHVPRSLYFMEQPPAGRIVLERAGETRAPSAAVSESAPRDELALAAGADAPPEGAPAARPATREPPREREVARSAPRRRAPPPRPAPEPPVAAAKAPPAKKSPQIQLIDARVPRVQVLE